MSGTSHYRNEELLKQIGLLVRQLRIEKGMTHAQLQAETGINIYRVETGSVNLSVSALELICTALDLKAKDFFTLLDEVKS